MRGLVTEISHKEAIDFLLPRHYSGRTPPISKAYGWTVDGKLQAVCTFGKPSSPSLCTGICGEKWSGSVYELNRLCREEDFNEPLSAFVSACLRRLRVMNWIIVSYSDTQMTHHGYIYQATNFLYTGMTKERTDRYSGAGKHSRHYDKNAECEIRQVRSSKHRYIYFCTRDRKLKKEWQRDLKYPILPYPKGDQQNYRLGSVMKAKLVNASTGQEIGWERLASETISEWLDRLLR